MVFWQLSLVAYFGKIFLKLTSEAQQLFELMNTTMSVILWLSNLNV